MKTKALLALLAPLAALAQIAPTPRPPTPPTAGETITLDRFKVEDTRSYAPRTSLTATKTDTPLKDVPFAASAVTRAVIDDQRALNLGEALRNVAGYQPQVGFGNLTSKPRLRGFTVPTTMKNGFRQQSFATASDFANIQQIEVLKGPASALYGRFEPGGAVNIVTKRPLEKAAATVDFTVGSDSYYRSTLDLSGPLGSQSLLYRLNLAVEDSESYRDFFSNRSYFVAPVAEWRVSADTKVTVELEGRYREGGFDRGYVVAPNATFARSLLDLPVSRNLGEPTDNTLYQGFVSSVIVDHRLNAAWALRLGGFYARTQLRDNFFTSGAPLMPNATTYNRRMLYGNDQETDYTFGTELAGKFSTGSVKHQVILGVDLNNEYYIYTATRTPVSSPINPFAPVYGNAIYGPVVLAFAGSTRYRADGLFVQDEISFTDQLKLTLGGRYDSTRGANFTSNGAGGGIDDSRTVAKFSPRAGLTFAATKELSFYANASRSFQPEIFGLLPGRKMTDPSVGTSYEGGLKTEFLGDRLGATFALYDVAKTNVVVSDPLNPGFSIQTGEQRSKGAELELTAQLAPGWNLLASYARDRAKITKDSNISLIGNRVVNVPEKTVSLWSTYEFTAGDLNGFKFGGGLFHVSDRPVNNANLFLLPSYNRYDAMASYRFGTWRVALNVQNVTDKKHFDSAGGVFHPMAPRQFFLNLSHAF